MSDYRVKISVRNARLMRALESIGHTPSSFAKTYGFHVNEMCALAALKIKPVWANGMWRKGVMKLCEVANVTPSDLFTPRQMEGLRASVAEREVDEDAIEAFLLPSHDPEQLAITRDLAAIIDDVIDSTLTPRSAKALRSFAEGATFDEIRREMNPPVSRDRARQIVLKAQGRVKGVLHRRKIR